MQVTYQLTLKDLREALTAHRNRSAGFMLRPGIYLLVLVLLGGLYLLTAYFDSARFSSISRLLPLGILWAAVLWALPWVNARRQFSRTPSFSARKIMSCNQNGIHWDWDGGSVNFEWKSFARLRETKRLLLLYTSPWAFQLVPKRAFSSEELVDFRALIGSKLSQGTG